MKQSQLYILIANIFIAGSFLTNHVWDSFAMLFLGIVWLIGAMFRATHERTLEFLHKKLEGVKFSLIVDLLSAKRGKRK
jgi:hypothetical protein